MSIIESLPDGAMRPADIEALRDHEKVERLEVVLEFSGQILSFTIQVGDNCYGVHSGHDTGDWEKVASGDDFQETLEEHKEWLDNDMDRVVG